jgi:hypothetical protein
MMRAALAGRFRGRRTLRQLCNQAIATGLVLWGSLNCVSAQSSRKCTNEEAAQADKNLDQLVDWVRVYSDFKRFGQCDDGALSEGWSDAIVKLLTKRWKTLPRLARMTATDKKFEAFVLRHVDELMSPDEARLIIRNSETRCPSAARRLCRKLEAKARR